LRLVAATTLALALAWCTAARGEVREVAQPGADDLRARFVAAGVPAEPLDAALRAYACAEARGEFSAPLLTLVDYSLPSTQPRLWVLDLAGAAVRFSGLVSHGRASGVQLATSFSNVPGSKQSSLGLFRTGETYIGAHGYSLRLVGLEPGVNHLAYERNIVIHGADYVTKGFVAKHGRLGRSWGCPALDPAQLRDVIDAIRGGSALFAYYPDTNWLASSSYLQCGDPIRSAAR
jgi:L,D-transpeptidase-like protein